MNTILRLAAAAVLAAASALAAAQDYPTKSIHVIVPLTPGSGADIAGRTAFYMALTYNRTAWGNRGAPVTPREANVLRAATLD